MEKDNEVSLLTEFADLYDTKQYNLIFYILENSNFQFMGI